MTRKGARNHMIPMTSNPKTTQALIMIFFFTALCSHSVWEARRKHVECRYHCYRHGLYSMAYRTGSPSEWLAEQVPLLIQSSREQSQFGFREQFGSPSVPAICLVRLVWSNWWALPSPSTILPALPCIVLSQRGLSVTLSRVMTP